MSDDEDKTELADALVSKYMQASEITNGVTTAVICFI